MHCMSYWIIGLIKKYSIINESSCLWTSRVQLGKMLVYNVCLVNKLSLNQSLGLTIKITKLKHCIREHNVWFNYI